METQPMRYPVTGLHTDDLLAGPMERTLKLSNNTPTCNQVLPALHDPQHDSMRT